MSATTSDLLYLLFLHDALPISLRTSACVLRYRTKAASAEERAAQSIPTTSPRTTDVRRSSCRCEASGLRNSDSGQRSGAPINASDRKSTRLNYSHVKISYAVFC